MVKVVINDYKLYQCEECGLEYPDQEWAEKCETWCREHHACNLEIIKNAVPSEDPRRL